MSTPSLLAALEALKAPFPPGEERYRAGPTWEQDGTRWTRPLPYIDARAVFDRLDQAVGPDHWHSELERLGPGVYLCRLTVLGVTRADVGQAGDREGEIEKSGASDAIKRAAVQLGVGRYLYDLDLPPARLERKGNDWILPRGWQPTPSSPPRQASPAVASPPMSGAITPKQLAKIEHEMARAGWADDRGRQHLAEAFGKRSRKELTSAEASRFIDHLLALPGPNPSRPLSLASPGP